MTKIQRVEGKRMYDPDVPLQGLSLNSKPVIALTKTYPF